MAIKVTATAKRKVKQSVYGVGLTSPALRIVFSGVG